MSALARSYSISELQLTRCTPVFSLTASKLMFEITSNKFDANWIDTSYAPTFIEKQFTTDVFNKFKVTFLSQIQSSTRNTFTGFDKFPNIDICAGCTQYIDNLYLLYGQENIQVLVGEYPYHTRLYPKTSFVTVNTLIPDKHLIISLPFATGNIHLDMQQILDECIKLNITVHIDAAWLGIANNITFNFSHHAINSIGLSMSKGYGLGWNRIGLRLQRAAINDSIKIINDFNMLPAITVCVGNYFLDKLNFDHMWDTYEQFYYKICKDFNLTPTNSVHVALDSTGNTVGLCRLLMFLESNN